jgi:hypothetical protein
VRSFHAPATPGTCAWPPSFPSVPTSFATRVTSDANALSWSTIVFTVVPIRRNSPCTDFPSISSTIFCERSPLATALITRATSLVGATRSVTSELSAPALSAQPPVMPSSETRAVMSPFRPTISLMRLSSLVIRSFREATSLNADTMSAMSGSRDLGNRTAKSPPRRSRRPASNAFRSARVIPSEGSPFSTSASSVPAVEDEFRSARRPPLLDGRRDRREVGSDEDALSLRPGRSRSTCGSRSPATGTPSVRMGWDGKELFRSSP